MGMFSDIFGQITGIGAGGAPSAGSGTSDVNYGNVSNKPQETINERQRAYLATLTPSGPIVPLSQAVTAQQVADYAAAGHVVSKRKAQAAPDGSALARQWVEAVYRYWLAYNVAVRGDITLARTNAAGGDREADKAYAMDRASRPVATGPSSGSSGGSGGGSVTPVAPPPPPPLQYTGASFGKWAIILGVLIAGGMILGKNKKFAKLPVISLFAGGKKSRKGRRRR